jgi:hypothetical protein
MTWCDDNRVGSITAVQPLHVAALDRATLEHAAPTVKLRQDRLADSVAPTTSCVTFSVPAPELISQSPMTTAGSTSFAAPQRF